MSLSDNDDDFLSADEDGFGDDQKVVVAETSKIYTGDDDDDDSSIVDECVKEAVKIMRKECVIESATEKAKPSLDDRNIDGATQKTTRKTSKVSRAYEESEPTVQDRAGEHEEEEDEGEVLAKIRARISERNIKIARKFSQGKTTKASDPIPVIRGSNSAMEAFRTNYEDYSNTPDSYTKSSPPPAPPPTPALSTSFNSNENVGASPSGETQYGWRVPSKVSRQSPAEKSLEDTKIEQTRLALDRLSASLSQADNKNLFEKVAEDIKKVSMAPKDSPNADSPGGSGGIPLISDLSSTLGGWKWNGASKLLASASQVTSQVGSVFESVVNVSSQSSQLSPESLLKSRTEATEQNKPSERIIEQSEGEQLPASGHVPSTSANPNDGLMDFTLNAMESLGKKAFGVMTERDGSGSLQIKGLGRPWEHLMNVNKPQHQDEDDYAAANNSEPTNAFRSVNRSKKDD